MSDDVLIESYEEGHSVAAYCAAAAAEAVMAATRASQAVLRTATHSNSMLVSRAAQRFEDAVDDAQRAVQEALDDEFWKPKTGKASVIPLSQVCNVAMIIQRSLARSLICIFNMQERAKLMGKDVVLAGTTTYL